MKARLVSHSEIDKKEWDNFVQGSPQGSVFLQSDFIDTVLPGGWSGITVYNETGLQAIMPINILSKWGLRHALQPFFTKYWGVAFAGNDFKNTYKQYSWKKKIVAAIMAAIPGNLAAFEYNFHPQFDYPLPFYWGKYSLQTRYTGILDVAGFSEDEIFRNYTDSLKNSIRTAEKNGITIIHDSSAEALLNIVKENEKAGKIIMSSRYYHQWKDLFNWADKSGNGFVLTALDADKSPVASSFYLSDNRCTYALSHTVLSSHKGSDALSLLVHQAIVRSAAQNHNFDFLGSMTESFEAFNRRFGARPVPYLNLSKKNLFLTVLGR